MHANKALILLAAALLAASTGSQANPAFVLDSKHAQWTGAEGGGAFAAFTIAELGAGMPPTSAPQDMEEPWFHLDASQLQLEIDSADVFLGRGVRASSPAATETRTYDDVSMEGIGGRDGHTLFVFPLDAGATAAVPCATARPSSLQSVMADSQLSARDDVQASVAGTLEVEPCSGSEVVVRGDFLLVLWERDAVLHSTDGDVELWSGTRRQAILPDPTGAADGRPFVNQAQQLYLTVRGGELRLPAVDGHDPLVYAAEVPLANATAVTLAQAAGAVAGQAVQGRVIELGGAIQATLRAAGDRVHFESAGGVESLRVDGSAYALASTARAPERSPMWPWLVAGAAAVSAPLALLARPRLARWADDRRERRLVLLEAKADELRACRKVGKALRVTSRMLDLAPNDVDAVYLHAAALGDKGRQGDVAACRQALEHHAHAARILRSMNDAPMAAQNAFQAALAAATAHRFAPEAGRDALHDLALQWLVQAVQHDAGMEAQFGLHEELQPFLPSLVAVLAMRGVQSEWLQR